MQQEIPNINKFEKSICKNGIKMKRDIRLRQKVENESSALGAVV